MKPQHFVRLGLLVLGMASASCGTVREGSGTSFLIIDRLEFAPGNDRTQFVGDAALGRRNVADEVRTSTISRGRRSRSGSRIPGRRRPETPRRRTSSSPSTAITSGSSVPTAGTPRASTCPMGSTAPSPRPSAAARRRALFVVVRHDAKREAPLAVLGTNRLILTIIAEITFYGRDQTGHEFRHGPGLDRLRELRHRRVDRGHRTDGFMYEHQTRSFSRAVAGLLVALPAACTMKSEEAPPFTGPSEFGKSINVTVTPDAIIQDGASQSVVMVTALGVNSEPLANMSASRGDPASTTCRPTSAAFRRGTS